MAYPPHDERQQWPVPQQRIERLREGLATDESAEAETGTRGLDAWHAELDSLVAGGSVDPVDADPLFRLFDWLGSQPSAPEPADVHDTFEPLVAAYREFVLPAHLASDTDDLQVTARHARAVVRWEQLLGDVRAKYDDWLADGYAERSWPVVWDLAERIAATRPGRREHANAAAIDVVDATDAWLRSSPVVVALGLVDGDWPQSPESVFPASLRTAVVDGTSESARRLAVPGRWTDAREFDHFRSAVDAATDHVVCTRYRRRIDGTSVERSPYLDELDATPAGEGPVEALLNDGKLPAGISQSLGVLDDRGRR